MWVLAPSGCHRCEYPYKASFTGHLQKSHRQEDEESEGEKASGDELTNATAELDTNHDKGNEEAPGAKKRKPLQIMETGDEDAEEEPDSLTAQTVDDSAEATMSESGGGDPGTAEKVRKKKKKKKKEVTVGGLRRC